MPLAWYSSRRVRDWMASKSAPGDRDEGGRLEGSRSRGGDGALLWPALASFPAPSFGSLPTSALLVSLDLVIVSLPPLFLLFVKDLIFISLAVVE